MADIYDILSREWPLISEAPVLVISGGVSDVDTEH